MHRKTTVTRLGRPLSKEQNRTPCGRECGAGAPGGHCWWEGRWGSRRRGPRTLRREPPCKDLEVSVQERNSTSDSDSQPKRKECSLSACLSVAESVASEAHFCRGSDGGPAPPQVASALSLREEDQGPVSLQCVGGIGLGSRQSAALCFALRHRLPRELDSACVCVLFLPGKCGQPLSCRL